MSFSPEARAYGATIARKLLAGRKGHGGAPISFRVFREAEITALVAIAYQAGKDAK